jgi:hypothetical protein
MSSLEFPGTILSNGDSSASVACWLTLHSRTLNSIACSVDCLQDNSSVRTPRKTPSSVVKNACLLARYLAMDICELHRKHFLRHWFCCYVRVFRALPRNGSTCHNMILTVKSDYFSKQLQPVGLCNVIEILDELQMIKHINCKLCLEGTSACVWFYHSVS